jgi:SNF2-related domain/Poly(ADP-ribose) polymerase and DNA-Ligase Zn-finger region
MASTATTPLSSSSSSSHKDEANDAMIAVKKGDVVWVLSGNQHEEPATVVETGCCRPSEESNSSSNSCSSDSDDDEDDKEEQEEKEEVVVKKDGILVRFHVSNIKKVFAPDKVRPFAETACTAAPSSSSSSAAATTTARPPPIRRSTRNRSVVTPSPNAEKAAIIIMATAEEKGEDDSPSSDIMQEEEEEEKKKPPVKRKQASVASSSSAKKEKEQHEEDDDDDDKEDDDDSPKSSSSSSPYFPKNTRRPTAAFAAAASRKKNKETTIIINSDNDSVMYCLPVGRPLPAAAAAAAAARNDSSASEDDEEEENEDLPYIVEYSPTGRATCRRCDQVIAKGDVRISHQPVFRGKPGFRVYRHLSCALFDDQTVQSATDIGGWRNLSRADFQCLQHRVDAAREELQKEEQELSPDELVPTAFLGETRAAPLGFVGNLLPFQVEGLSWMRHQEVHVPELRGGILADEMGMGKTIQTIATILDNRTLLQHSKVGAKHDASSPDLAARKAEEALWQTSVKEWTMEMKMLNVPPKMWPKKTIAAARAGTLVVCPVIALNQWKTEIEKFTVQDEDDDDDKPGGGGNIKALTVAIYHGPNRAKDLPPEKMRLYDVILTTYQVLEQGMRFVVFNDDVHVLERYKEVHLLSFHV